MKARWFLEATGSAVVLLFPVLAPVVSPGYRFVYHHQTPLTHLMNGLLLDFAGLTVAGLLVMVLLPHLSSVPRRLASGCLTGLFLWTFAYCAIILATNWEWRDLSELPGPSVMGSIDVMWHRWGFPLATGLPLVLSALAWLRPGAGRVAVRATRFALAAVAFCSVWIVLKLVYLDFNAHASTPVLAASAEAEGGRKGRIVGILFDELSYKLAVSEPPRGQDFPNLRRLHAESISFGNLKPVGNFTELIIPSVLARREIAGIRSTPDGRPFYQERTQREWKRYEPSETIFGIARANGWNAGVAGWDIPYCRIFGGLLTRCFWQPGIGNGLAFEPWAGEKTSAISYAWALPRAFAAQLYSRREANNKRLAGMIVDGQQLMAAGEDMLRDTRVHFVFIHLPVPHPPGVYDRRTHRPCECGNYLDNLTMADDMLGRLMQEIDETSGTAGTAVIVSSDHSFRVPMWKASPYWSAEEERVTQGVFDPRPVFMVHFAGERAGREVMASLPELVEYDVIAGMLKGKITAPSDVEELVSSPAEVAAAEGH
jgi:hypothetical protein